MSRGVVDGVSHGAAGMWGTMPRRVPQAAAGRRGLSEQSGVVPRSPRVRVSDSGTEHDDRAQHLSAGHLGEGILDGVEGDGLADEAVEVEGAP
jgi:hypothetical protein